MFHAVFAAIGIPLTIIFFKHLGKLISLPFENLGNYLKYKGINEVSFLSLFTQSHTHTYLGEKFCLWIHNLRLTRHMTFYIYWIHVE